MKIYNLTIYYLRFIYYFKDLVIYDVKSKLPNIQIANK